MVTRRNRQKDPGHPCTRIPLNPSLFSVQELEQRMEAARLHGAAFEACNCLETLCQCDGWDCVEVCGSHCLIHYA